jgi:hypothetical protein
MCSPCRKIFGENLFREVFGEPYTHLHSYIWSRSTRPPRCIIGMESLAQRSFYLRDFVSWLERKCEHTRERLR